MSTGGTPDFKFQSAVPDPGGPGFSFVMLQQAAGVQPQSIVAGEALQADGKVVVVATQFDYFNRSGKQYQIAVGRLDPNGEADAAFGHQGSVFFTGSGPGIGMDKGVAVAVQADGKILVIGDVTPSAPGSLSEVVAYRLNADGSTDATFGSAGMVAFDFDRGTTALSSTATTLAIQPDGKIVVGGLAGGGVALARFNTDGTLDSTFGTSGQAMVTFKAGTIPLRDAQGVAGLAIQADGKIAFDTTVMLTSGTGAEIAAGRLNADGSADSTFGTGGQVLIDNSNSDTASGLAIQPAGNLILSGQFAATFDQMSPNHFDVIRLDATGSLDTTFGTMGEATIATDPTANYQALGSTVVAQSDGKIVVGGSVGGTTYQAPFVSRLNADGSPDLEFGTGGRYDLPYSFGNQAYQGTDTVYGLAVQPDGKILAALGDGVARLLGRGASNDFDNDGTTDPAILLTRFAVPIFAYRPSGGGGDVLEGFGTTGVGQTLPAPGAYDGSGVDELAVYLPALGDYGIRPSGTTGPSDQLIPIGLKGVGQSIPEPADYTGSGHAEIAVYEPATGSFVYSPTNSADPMTDVTVQLGTPGAGNSIPAPSDYYGTGQDDFAVYLTQYGVFAVKDPTGMTPGEEVQFGMPGQGNSLPVPGDYDGSGHTELAVYMPTIGAFAYRPYGGGPDKIIQFGTPGLGNSIPMPGDYDGSGHTELAVYLPKLGAYAYRPYGGGPDKIIAFGDPGAGASIPFNTIASTAIGGGPSHHPSGSPGWLDFVPDLAGQAKKKGDGTSSTTTTQSRS